MRHTVSLKRNGDFKRLYNRGKSGADSFLAVYCLRNRVKINRLGITVSVKVGGAVVRNRVRRRIREAYRLHEAGFLSGHDIVVVSRVRAAEADMNRICASLLQVSEKLGLYDRDRDDA